MFYSLPSPKININIFGFFCSGGGGGGGYFLCFISPTLVTVVKCEF